MNLQGTIHTDVSKQYEIILCQLSQYRGQATYLDNLALDKGCLLALMDGHLTGVDDKEKVTDLTFRHDHLVHLVIVKFHLATQVFHLLRVAKLGKKLVLLDLDLQHGNVFWVASS